MNPEKSVNDLEEKNNQLAISHVPFRPHLIITDRWSLSAGLNLRIPEFIRNKETKKGGHITGIKWEIIEPERHLTFKWAADPAVKKEAGLDFWASARAYADEIYFEVTMRNISPGVNTHELSLFCLQAGAVYGFQDYEGERTFLRCGDRWRSVGDLVQGRWERHRMTGFRFVPEGKDVTEKLMVKESSEGNLALGFAVNLADNVSCNHQLWPSCIHSNPFWGELQPGEEKTCCGRVYLVEGCKDDILDRYIKDFC